MKLIYKDDWVKLIQGDCLEVMDKMIEKGIKFDAIITDPPYGTTACKWDSIIPFDKMWERLNKLISEVGAICLFGSEPFSSFLRTSNIEDFKYDWVWIKSRALGFTHTKNAPMKKHEIISVFSKAKIKHMGQSNRMTYNPQGLVPCGKIVNGDKSCKADAEGHRFARPSNKSYVQEFTNYPTSILNFNNEGNTQHPTQKPLALMEYLINTYTSENDLILDFTCGSGTTLVAARNLHRKCYGIELEEKYCEVAKERLQTQNIK